MVEDARTYWVAGGGSPMASILLAKKLYAPNAVYVTEDGVDQPGADAAAGSDDDDGQLAGRRTGRCSGGR